MKSALSLSQGQLETDTGQNTGLTHITTGDTDYGIFAVEDIGDVTAASGLVGTSETAAADLTFTRSIRHTFCRKETDGFAVTIIDGRGFS